MPKQRINLYFRFFYYFVARLINKSKGFGKSSKIQNRFERNVGQTLAKYEFLLDNLFFANIDGPGSSEG